MFESRRNRTTTLLSVCLLTLFSWTSLHALTVSENRPVRDLSSRERIREGGVLGIQTIAPSTLPAGDLLREGWERFIADRNGSWAIRLDLRSGLPALASGEGIPWIPGPANSLEETGEPAAGRLERLAREFLDSHSFLLGDWQGQLELNEGMTTPLGGGRAWQISFRQVVNSVPVEGSHFNFQVVQGNLVAFGAVKWARVHTSAVPSLGREEARKKLETYLGLDDPGRYVDLDSGSLHLVPVNPAPGEQAYDGPAGNGIDHKLVWRFAFYDPEEDPNWVGEVDAHTGQVFSFFDDTKYDRIKGHVNPISDDGDCANGGCPTPDYPMPYTDYSLDGGADQYAGDFGLYTCATLGSTVETNLDGPYIWINDQCGTTSESTTCDNDLDMGVNDGVNCAVAPGASPGNTDAARSAYYSLNRVNQKARFWIPNNTWLQNPVECRSNVNATCNASWGGRINMYRAGGGCGNTSMIQGVVVHEWGHGMDQNDGGGYDNPSEAYADVVAIFEARRSCVGRGFRPGQVCSGYGDTCLTCTGIRDMDWDARQAHTPATPSGFNTNNCGGGGGPCGKEVHCASYVPSETMFDLATRDLPAAGMDPDSAWQTAERLWYESRPGSSGDVYNCSLPASDSCGTTSWYHQLRLMDDDDGNLANGTPHAGAIFAAFNRHDIACGNVNDAENQSSGSCPTLAAPVFTTRTLTNAVELNWDPVAGASSYRVYRNENGCDRSQVPLAEVTGTTYLDDGLANGFDVYYRVEAIGSNSACTSPVSACQSAAAQPLAGRIRFDQSTYGCSNEIGMQVTDANHSSGTMTVTIWSDTEPAPESVLLTETAPGSGKFIGSIFSTSASPAADGMLSTTNGDRITAEYIDEDDGNGGFNVPVQSTADSDCVFPVITAVDESGITGTRATVTWTTNELADTELVWGETTPPANVKAGGNRVTAHSVTLTGLTECTVYYYEVHSTDPAGNTAADDNGGAWYRFETLGDFGSGLQPCHAGQVAVLDPVYSCNDTASFKVTDIDLNADPAVPETVDIQVTSTTETEAETLTLTETGPNTSVFTGSLSTAAGAPVHDGAIQASDGDILTATYHDADDGAGFPAISYDTGILDCAGPAVSNLRVHAQTTARATFSWNTEEQADTVIEWGTTPALGNVESSGALVVNHDTVLHRFHSCEPLWFRVRSTDVHGNTTIADDHGAPFAFRSWEVAGLYAMDDFESGAGGWSLSGEWEIDPPSGLGGSSGPADPAEAYNNDAVLGHDLTGLGSFPYDYEPNVANESALSPVYDASTWTNTRLIFYRRLNVGSNDNASLWLWTNGVARPIYRSDGSAVTETSFSAQALDLGALIDGASTVQLEFKQSSDGSGNYSGWNVDDLILKNGTLPDYGACGSCGTAPAFEGAVSATDNDACGATGVTVSWKQAAAWGTGENGTYAVYRDTVPGFTPSPANRIAAGINALSYNDLSAPLDTVLYYIVRAENDETCGGGPNNGGLVDGNVAPVQVSETTTTSLPPEIGSVQVLLVGDAHVRLDWNPVAGAVRYRIYRSLSPQPENFGLLAETGDPFYEDLGEGANQNDYYYKVRGVNACGQEGN